MTEEQEQLEAGDGKKGEMGEMGERGERGISAAVSSSLPTAGAGSSSRRETLAANRTDKTDGKKLSRGKIIGAVIVVALVWFLAVQILAAERYTAVVQVISGENQVGINPTADKLDFGDLSRGTGASRYVTIKNSGKSEKFIWVIKFGEIADLMSVSENKLTIKAGEEVKLELAVKIPVSALDKIYKGRVMIFRWPALW